MFDSLGMKVLQRVILLDYAEDVVAETITLFSLTEDFIIFIGWVKGIENYSICTAEEYYYIP